MQFKSALAGLFAVLVTIGLLTCSCGADETKTVLRDGDRIVFVGDSITGQGGNLAQGWTHLMAEALAATHPAGAPTLIALGGSGQTVGSWQNIEKKSREESVTLDVKGVDVKSTLDQPADVLIIMLGMNDVLSPSLSTDDAAFDAWAVRYRALIASLRERTKPRVLALATVPLCTEDEQSPKNQVIASLTQRIKAIAQTENAIVLPVHEAMLETLHQGRTLRPDFHVTGDFVHPNSAGHLAIAQGMLKGLGEAAAAQNLSEKYGLKTWGQSAEKLPSLSYAVEYSPAALDSDIQTCKIRFWWTSTLPGQKAAALAPPVRLSAPAGWKVSPASIAAESGEFIVSGPFDHLKNQLALEATGGVLNQKTEVSLPAPWLIGTANLRQVVWVDKNSRFDPDKGRLTLDDTLTRGEGWGKPVELAPDHPMKWLRHNPTVNYLGGAQPGSVDMAGVTFFQSFEVGYGARWIYSERDRSVQFKLGSQSFGGNDYLAFWMNGESVYSGHIMPDRGKIVEAKLRKGWNALVFKSNHLQWQWHFSIDLVETAADDLGDLRVSIVPHNN
jgi:lysophospholipase L1-like esterase